LQRVGSDYASNLILRIFKKETQALIAQSPKNIFASPHTATRAAYR